LERPSAHHPGCTRESCFLERVAPKPCELGPDRGGHRRLERKVARVVDPPQERDDVRAILVAPLTGAMELEAVTA